ncbi:MAG: nuclear protein [Hyphomicrobiales bacterium]|nr:nuclear protein [Hyphomicrobiales bacterium]
MFLIRTRVGPSSIHGTGVFADEAVAAGQPVWRFNPVFDRMFPDADFDAAPPSVQAFLREYAYRATDLDGSWVLSGDHARFLNHSDEPNTIERPFESYAAVDIAAGDEITCDYGAFCLDWTRADLGEETAADQLALPHRHLHTRIKPAQHGVGVFALHDIPAGVLLFEGDEGDTVRVPVSVVDAIPDEAVRRMYLDFCPEEDGALIAPVDFNQLTIGWHVNHSETPNVVVDADMQFRSKAPIRAGEELTTDYRTYSASAQRLIGTWTK